MPAAWAWRRRRDKRNAGLLTHARTQLQRFLAGECAGAELIAAFSALPLDLQVSVFAGLELTLRGHQRQELRDIARQLGLISRAESWCRSRFWWRRLHGARLLTILDAGEAAVPALLRDPHIEVRAQAAEWAADHATPEVIAALLHLLSDESGLCRFTVEDSLERIGRAAVGPLVDFLQQHSGPAAAPALTVAAGIGDLRLLPCAFLHCKDSHPETRAAAAELLGSLGGNEAVARLQELLCDPHSTVRTAATRALGALKYWPAAPRVVELLRDSAWAVRREAGLALREFGAPGLLMLRRALTDADRFAADMARQALDLQEQT